MGTALDVQDAARRVVDALDHGQPLGLFTEADPGFDEAAAYEVAHAVEVLRTARGETPIGRKMGLTNRATWPAYDVEGPIWGPVYDTTTTFAAAGDVVTLPVGGMVQPQVEPEVQLHLCRPLPAEPDEDEVLACVDWIALGFEVVQCPYPAWRFKAPDAIAACAVHGALVVGPPVPVRDPADCREALRGFTLTLLRNHEPVAHGRGADVLDSPAAALGHLVRALAGRPDAVPLRAGEVVSTGTLTALQPAVAGDRWSTAVLGLDVPPVTLALA